MNLRNLQPQQIKLLKRIGIALAVLIVLYWIFGPSSKPPQHVFAPAVPVTPAPVEEKPAPTPPPNASNSQTILELFNPSDQALTHQLNDTNTSQQIEQAMTVSFVLTKCQIISQDDYRDVFRALITYAQQSKLAPDEAAAETTVRQISESAKASYALIYSRTSCTDSQLPTLANQIVEWTRKTLSQ